MQNGSNEDKVVASVINDLRKKWKASLLKNINQLPDLQGDQMIFVLKEVEKNKEKFLEIRYKNKVIWKELLTYEYFRRFIEIGKLFKRKYGHNMIDLVPDADTDCLYGDKMSAPYSIEMFRKELRSKN